MKLHLPNFLRSALLRCVTSAALIATCSSYAFADTETLTLTFSETEAPIVLLSENDLLVTETGDSALLTAASFPASSDGLILAGTTTYTNGTYTRSEKTLHLTANQDYQSYESIVFDKNKETSSAYSTAVLGGAIYADSDNSLNFSSNGDITFSGNTASTTNNSSFVYGGAIYATSSTLTFTNNGDINFSGNTSSATGSAADAHGGAIYATSTLTFTGNSNIIFSGNQVSASYSSSGAFGGAIDAGSRALSFTDNDDITFSGNTAITPSASSYSLYRSNACGGAIDAGGDLAFTGNGSIIFCNNISSSRNFLALGGAIYAGNSSSALTFVNNEAITFSGNTSKATGTGSSSQALGGAIYAHSTLTIQGAALFEKNLEVSGGTYRLRSIYQDGKSLELSAFADKSIEFRDSIYSSATTVSLNKDYSQKADGTIRFTGTTTESDLKAMKGSAGTTTEIASSRTSELTGAVTLYGGNLVIEEKAILNISGSLTVEGGNITVATGAQLNLAKADITMPSLTMGGGTMMLGSEDDHDATLTLTTLTVTADSVLNANLEMTSGTITFAKDASITLGCSVTLGDGVVLNISDEAQESAAAGNLVTLMTSVESLTCGGKTYTASELNENVKIQGVFSNYQSADHCLVYTQSGDLMVTPEPATATLSLLALAGLAARRRLR